MTTTTDSLPDVPLPDVAPPPGFTADTWFPGDRDDPRPSRFVRWERAIPDEKACIEIRALQYADGTLFEPELFVHIMTDDGLSSGEARELARLLIAAADELDRLK